MNDQDLLYFEKHQSEDNTQWVLLVHGAGGSTRTWKRQIASIGAHYNLLVIDLPGHGKNANKTSNSSSYTFESVAKKMWAVVDHLEIERLHLVGISLGTILCLEMREQAPERIVSVILPGAIVQLDTKMKILANLSLRLAKIIGFPAFYRLSARIMLPRSNHKKSRDVFIKESQVLTTEEFKKWTSMYYHLNETLKILFNASFTIPHLLVMGDQDHLFLHSAQAFAQKHDNANISVIPKCGHVVSIERAEQFNEICLRFLKKQQINQTPSLQN